METVIRLAILAAIFGVGGWAGYALSHPAPVEAPLPRPPAVPAAPMGDLDGGTPVRPKSVAPSVAVPNKVSGAPERITFADLSQWDLDPKDVQVPASVLAYAGKEIDIVGYMIPYGNPDAIEEFVLVKDLGSCCFGQAPQPHHLIECRFVEGKKTSYVAGPVRVRGRFRVEEHRQGQYLVSVFAMTATDCVEVR
jgi:hypothetical protein